MKKISLIALAGAIFAFSANAANKDMLNGDMPAPNVGGAGFVGEETFVSVRDAKNMADDTVMVLRGNIVQSLGDEKYVFRDTTDSITVEIEDDNWRGISVSPGDTVVIYGELDVGPTTEIEVNRIEVLQ